MLVSSDIKLERNGARANPSPRLGWVVEDHIKLIPIPISLGYEEKTHIAKRLNREVETCDTALDRGSSRCGGDCHRAVIVGRAAAPPDGPPKDLSSRVRCEGRQVRRWREGGQRVRVCSGPLRRSRRLHHSLAERLQGRGTVRESTKDTFVLTTGERAGSTEIKSKREVSLAPPGRLALTKNCPFQPQGTLCGPPPWRAR